MYFKSKKNLLFFKSIILSLFISFSFSLFSQPDTLYVDENEEVVSKFIFDKKMKSTIYQDLRFDTDSTVLFKLRYNYYFGKLSPKTKGKLFKFLNNNYNIDTTKTLVISYSDTLRAKNEFPEVDLLIETVNGFKKFPSYKNFIKNKKQGIKYYNGFKRKLTKLNFYHFNNGHPETFDGIRWCKDNYAIMKNIFSFLENDLKVIILHPDGEFYLESKENELPFTSLFLKKNWFKYKNDFITKVKDLNNY